MEMCVIPNSSGIHLRLAPPVANLTLPVWVLLVNHRNSGFPWQSSSWAPFKDTIKSYQRGCSLGAWIYDILLKYVIFHGFLFLNWRAMFLLIKALHLEFWRYYYRILLFLPQLPYLCLSSFSLITLKSSALLFCLSTSDCYSCSSACYFFLLWASVLDSLLGISHNPSLAFPS